VDPNTIELAALPTTSSAIPITPTAASSLQTITPSGGAPLTFDSSSDVDGTKKTISLPGHGLISGQLVTYSIGAAARTHPGVGGGTKISAGGSFTLASDSNHTLSATAYAKGGGFIANNIAHTDAAITYSTTTSIGAGANVSAGGAVIDLATSQVTANTDA